MVSDTQSLTVTCDNIGIKTRGQEGPVSVHYDLGTDKSNDDDEEGSGTEGFFNSDGIMCSFRMRTLDAMCVFFLCCVCVFFFTYHEFPVCVCVLCMDQWKTLNAFWRHFGNAR